MRTRARLVAALALTLGGGLLPLSGCAKAAAPSVYKPTATIKDIMDSLVDPSADFLWESVATEVSAAGIVERAPRTDDEWKEAHRNAVRLVEATNLLVMPGRLVAKPGEKSENPGIELGPDEIQKVIDADRDDFIRLAHDLYDKAMFMLKATEARDVKALFDSGEAVDVACENCHLKYWYPEEARPQEAPSMKKTDASQETAPK